MMQVNYSNDAFTSLTNLVNFIDANNTRGAGLRWLERFEVFLAKALFKPTPNKTLPQRYAESTTTSLHLF